MNLTKRSMAELRKGASGATSVHPTTDTSGKAEAIGARAVPARSIVNRAALQHLDSTTLLRRLDGERPS